MKKIMMTIAACVALTACFGACKASGGETSGNSSAPTQSSAPATSDSVPSTPENSGGVSSPEDSSTPEDSSGGESGGTESTYTYTDFTQAEKAEFIDCIGEVIPFAPTNEYYVDSYSQDYETERETGVNFYAVGNTQADFNAYLQALSARYTSDGTEKDEYGDTWYYFTATDYYIDASYYLYDGDYIIDVYAYILTESGSGSEGGGTGTSYTYTDFTQAEKNQFIDCIGEVIPFAATNEYYVDSYSEDYETERETGINFYAVGNTQADFNAYLQALSARYTSDGTEEDEYGDTWYYFTAADYYIDASYYLYDGDYIIDVYAYILTEDNTGGSGSEGEWDDFEPGTGDSGGDSGNTGGGSTGGNEELLTNDGKGLPTGTNGVHTVDFTKAKYVKDVTDQGYYLDGCPTVGKPAVLVIPVEFSDATALNKGYTVDKVKAAFNGGAGETDYQSVHDYYYTSSYGKLDIQFTVLDSWFKPQYASSYYQNQTMDMDGTEIECGDQMVIDEALAYLEGKMDLSQFDSDGNSTIDAVVVINTLTIDSEVTFQWAYRYWNMYTDDDGYYYEYDGVSANDYLWAPYQFLYDDNYGNYDDKSAMNTYTFIHEFGHVLGADDYYDTAYVGSPMDGHDVMDSEVGDHNGYTKFNYGWITSSRLVTASDSVTLTLDAFTKNGDTVLIANNWDDELGAYQEYFLVVYYTNDGLNSGAGGYFDDEGIVVYHVNASLYKEVIGEDTYYDVYNNNTDPSDPDYGTEDNLIELVSAGYGSYVYGVGDSLSSSVTTSQGDKIAYTFTVDALTDSSATLTFQKNK